MTHFIFRRDIGTYLYPTLEQYREAFARIPGDWHDIRIFPLPSGVMLFMRNQDPPYTNPRTGEPEFHGWCRAVYDPATDEFKISHHPPNFDGQDAHDAEFGCGWIDPYTPGGDFDCTATEFFGAQDGMIAGPFQSPPPESVSA